MSDGLRRAHASRWFDPALAIVLTCLPLVELLARPELTNSPRAPIEVIVLGATVAVRRTHPLVAACTQALVFVATPNFDDNFLPDSGVAVVLIVAYSCGAHASKGRGLAAVATLAACQQLGMGFSEFPNFEVYFATLVPWWVGLQVSRRRRLANQLARRTAQLEAEEDAFGRLSVRRERARIARELHDIVAHHLAVIAVQAGAGRMTPAGEPMADADRFATIRQSGDQALAEMAQLVDILDSGRGRGAIVGRLRVLVDEAAAAGLDVGFTAFQPDLQLRAEIEDAAYRIVREGLTNAMKHAPGAAVHVLAANEEDHLAIEVRDTGGAGASGLAATGLGLGLKGLRERVEALGGALEGGGQPGGGWRLTGRLPTSAEREPVRH